MHAYWPSVFKRNVCSRPLPFIVMNLSRLGLLNFRILLKDLFLSICVCMCKFVLMIAVPTETKEGMEAPWSRSQRLL